MAGSVQSTMYEDISPTQILEDDALRPIDELDLILIIIFGVVAALILIICVLGYIACLVMKKHKEHRITKPETSGNGKCIEQITFQNEAVLFVTSNITQTSIDSLDATPMGFSVLSVASLSSNLTDDGLIDMNTGEDDVENMHCDEGVDDRSENDLYQIVSPTQSDTTKTESCI